MIREIKDVEVKTLIEENKAFLIDVREEEDYKKSHIEKAINIPFSIFEENELIKRNIKKEDNIIVYCKAGKRSQMVSYYLEKLDYKNIFNMGSISNYSFDLAKEKN